MHLYSWLYFAHPKDTIELSNKTEVQDMALQGIGNRIKAIRQDRGFTQKQLAGLLGVTEQAVSKWERETSYPDISMLNGISEVMDCSLDYLFQYESGKKNLLDQDSIERRAEVNRHLLPDIISLEFGEGLVPVFLSEDRQGFPHINGLRCQAASQWGVILPVIRMLDQMALGSDQYRININGVCMYEGRQKDMDEDSLEGILEKLKDTIFKNIEFVLNNQTIYHMVENLRAQYPYVVQDIIPDVVTYSMLRQVVIYLLKEQGCAVNPLILIIESMERHAGIRDPKELAGKVAVEIGEGFRF